MRIAVYPGTFDPITSGHLDIILRSLKLVDKLYVAIALDSSKKALFSAPERVAMIYAELEAYDVPKSLVEVETFSGLLINFAKERSINISIRGLRALADFEYEFQMACMNTILDPEIQTIFLPASTRLQLVSSKLVKEVTRLGGDTGEFLSNRVKEKLKKKLLSQHTT
jgi:pantetheine-phosphate adenylyltransferase